MWWFFFRGSIKLSGSRESILAATMILANEFLHVLAIFLLCLLKKSFFDPLWISHHAIPPISSFLLICPPPLQVPSQGKQANTTKSNPFPKNSFVMSAVVCHKLYPLAQTASLANVCYIESLVWFEASRFCHTSNIGSILGLLSVILLLPRVTEILQLWFCRIGPFTCSSGS